MTSAARTVSWWGTLSAGVIASVLLLPRYAAAETPTDTPADTPTISDTPTPTNTPAPPPGCQYVEVTPIAVYSTQAQGTGGSANLVAGACVQDTGGDSVTAEYRVVQDGEQSLLYGANIVLEWDAASFPIDRLITAAVLRIDVLDVTSAGGSADLRGDWIGGSGCTAEDYLSHGDGTALGGGGSCDANCLSAITPGVQDFPLRLAYNLQFGWTRLELTVLDAPSSQLRVANGQGALPGPRLVALACDPPPTPTVNVPAGCEVQVVPVPSEATVVGRSGDESPVCSDSALSDEGVPFLVAVCGTDDPEAAPLLDGKMLLEWPTGDLPAAEVVTAAWLRLFTLRGPKEMTSGGTLVGDWYHWGPSCDPTDYDAALATPAVAYSADAIPLGQYSDLPLADAAAQVARGAGATTDLRLGIELPSMTPGLSAVVELRAAVLLAGPGLVVELCPPPPTETPTDTPTDTRMVAGTATPTHTPAEAATETATPAANLTHTPIPAPTTTPTTTVPPDPALVAPPLDRSVATTVFDATAFLYSGPNPIQTGVAPDAIAPQRAAVLRGRVLQRDGSPLRAVTIRIAGAPEFGETLSRDDGRFDLAVNGGGLLTVDYAKAGYLPAQRQTTAPWQGFASLPDVVLVPVDPQVSDVVMGSPEPQLAAGSPVSDADGTRQAVLVFPAETVADLALPDGSTEALTFPTLHVHLTEYTVGSSGPQAMPAELPPASAYTYAVELSVDEPLPEGARVHFPTPIPLYVDNFVGFPVGGIVPLGEYDRTQRAWVPAPNGRVIQILSVSGGVAGLDTDGDGQADSDATLAALGITTSERQQLALYYPTGRRLWRVTVSYLSRFDCNWPGGYPADAIAPDGGPPQNADDGAERLTDVDTSTDGSIVYQTQTLVQRVPLAGTPFTLEYQSDRQLDRPALNTLRIPLSSPTTTLPASLRHIDVTVEVAGRQFPYCFAPLAEPGCPAVPADRLLTFTWDGTDVYGRVVQGGTLARVNVDYAYRRIYNEPATPAQSVRAFAAAMGGTPISTASPRGEIVAGRTWAGSVGGWDAQAEGLGGWSVDVHRTYNPLSGTLAGGDGSQTTSAQIGAVVHTVAGRTVDGWAAGFAGDGGPAAAAQLHSPQGLAVGPDGSLYITDAGNSRVRKIDPSGTITTVAGNGDWCWLSDPGGPGCGDGGPATQAALAGPVGVALGPDGSLYIADPGGPYSRYGGRRVRRVDPSGIMRTVAGTGAPTNRYDYAGSSGDGGPATLATLSGPTAVRVAADGTLYIVDAGNGRVRAVGTDGIIRTVAGGGPGYIGNSCTDGIAAVATPQCMWPYLIYCGANLSPQDLELGADGTLYIATGQMVRRVGPDGLIHTVAGSCSEGGDDGDGGVAVDATLEQAVGLALGRDGSLYVSDDQFQRVRRIDADGIITALAGQRIALNTPGAFAGDNGPATAARFGSLSPTRLAVAPDGSLYVADTGNHRIRKVSSALPGFAGLGDIGIPARDGRELYVFSDRGKHRCTIDALTGVLRYHFGYDDGGRLACIVDCGAAPARCTTCDAVDTCADTGDHSVTTIAHDAAGTPTVIIGPYGQRTAVSVDAHGYLAAITNPNAETTQFQLSDKGLLSSVTDAGGNTTSFTYDAEGRLQQSTYPTGSGSDTLTRTEVPVPNGSGYQVTHTTGTGVQTTYQVQFLGTGDQVQTTTLPDGTVQTTTVGTDGSRSVSQPDGVQQSVQQSPDPRFGMQAPVSNNMSVMTPDGLTATVTDSRTATLADPTNLLSLSSQTDTVSINGRQITRAWDASTRTLTDTSPVGRHTYTVLDAQGRTVEQQTGTLAPTEFAYDGTSRLIGIAQGSRASTLTYDAAGNVASVTDPAGRTVSFAYDGAGRVVVQTLPDLRQIVFDYDANGNVTAITPPGRPAHAFTYLPKGQLQFYWPPQPSPPLAEPRTRYDYYLDGELARITRPDGQQINFTTDPETGQLLAQALPTGQIYYRYDVVTGNLNEIDAPGETIVYTSDSSLPLSETWSGSVAGSVSRTYDNSFRVATQRVNGGSTVSFGYDADDLLTSAGALTLARDAQTGLLTGTTFGNVNDVYTYNTLGEVTGYQASVGGTPIFTEAYTRDALGRIAAKTETVQGTTETYGYSYDLAGRLTDVTRNGTLIGHYEYDDNGNRIPDANGDSTLTFNQAGMLFSATYDDQDRLLAIQQGPATVDYTYTANGELLSNTDTSTNTSTTYIYDVLGNLTEAVLPSGDVIDYVIDGQNRRVGKAINGTLVRSWLYDGQLKVVAELDGAGTLVSRFAYGTKANVPDYVVQGGMTYRIISDHLGSVRLVVNASTGAIAQRIDYAEFGNVLNDTSPGFQPFAFAGGLYDPATGFVRFGARDYAAELGRWAAKDPIRFDALDSNLYGYIFSDPIDASDSTGESADQMVIGQVGGTLPLISILSKTAFVGSAALFAAVVNNVIGEICRSDGTYRFVYGIPVCRYVCRDGTTFERPGKMTLGMVSCPRAAKRPQ